MASAVSHSSSSKASSEILLFLLWIIISDVRFLISISVFFFFIPIHLVFIILEIVFLFLCPILEWIFWCITSFVWRNSSGNVICCNAYWYGDVMSFSDGFLSSYGSERYCILDPEWEFLLDNLYSLSPSSHCLSGCYFLWCSYRSWGIYFSWNRVLLEVIAIVFGILG